jgi:hypothetical protein
MTKFHKSLSKRLRKISNDAHNAAKEMRKVSLIDEKTLYQMAFRLLEMSEKVKEKKDDE